jgi:hypothetical protein
MAKPKRDPIREDRIHDEAIVDAYGPEEQARGWYYYLEHKLRIPVSSQMHRSQGGCAAPERGDRRGMADGARRSVLQ